MVNLELYSVLLMSSKNKLSEKGLLEQWNLFVETNDSAAFNTIASQLHDDLLNYAIGKVSSIPQIDAQDIVQEVFIKLCKGKYKIEKSVKGYLLFMVNTKCMDELRKHKVPQSVPSFEEPAGLAEDKLREIDEQAKKCLSKDQYDFFYNYCNAYIAAIEDGGETAYERLVEIYGFTLEHARRKKQTVTQKLIRCMKKLEQSKFKND